MRKLILVSALAIGLSSSISGMNVQGNANDSFGRQMTEAITRLNEQHKQEMAALMAQNAADRQILMNELKQQKTDMRRMQAQHMREQKELKDQIKVLLDQREIDRAKVAALEQGNAIAQQANRVAEEQNRIAIQAAQEAQARENARNAERARLQRLIDSKNREINHLDVTYIHIPPNRQKTYNLGFTGRNAEYDAFCRAKGNAERKIPKLQAEVADLIRQRDSL